MSLWLTYSYRKRIKACRELQKKYGLRQLATSVRTPLPSWNATASAASCAVAQSAQLPASVPALVQAAPVSAARPDIVPSIAAAAAVVRYGAVATKTAHGKGFVSTPEGAQCLKTAGQQATRVVRYTLQEVEEEEGERQQQHRLRPWQSCNPESSGQAALSETPSQERPQLPLHSFLTAAQRAAVIAAAVAAEDSPSCTTEIFAPITSWTHRTHIAAQESAGVATSNGLERPQLGADMCTQWGAAQPPCWPALCQQEAAEKPDAVLIKEGSAAIEPALEEETTMELRSQVIHCRYFRRWSIRMLIINVSESTGDSDLERHGLCTKVYERERVQ